MADFDWLNKIPDEVCERHGEGRRRSFELSWFLAQSGLDANAEWRRDFDIWGASQPRPYQQFPCPPATDGTPLALIVWGAQERAPAG